MARIIQFPAARRAPRPVEVVELAPDPRDIGPWRILGRKWLFQLVYGVFLVLVIVTWPLLRWVVMIDLALQLMRMVLLWNEPGAYAGLTCLLHYVVVGATAYLALVVPQKAFK